MNPNKKTNKGKKYIAPKLYFTPPIFGEITMAAIASMDDEELGRYIQESKQIEYSRKYKANPDFLLRKIGDDYMLVPVGREAEINGLITINETASYLWKQFQTTTTISEVLARAQEKYHDLNGDMEREIRSFVAEYVNNKFIIEEKNI